MSLRHIKDMANGYMSEAVAAGMVQAAQMSYRLGLIRACDVERIENIIKKYHLPTKPPKIDVAQALDLMGHDKRLNKVKSAWCYCVVSVMRL